MFQHSHSSSKGIVAYPRHSEIILFQTGHILGAQLEEEGKLTLDVAPPKYWDRYCMLESCKQQLRVKVTILAHEANFDHPRLSPLDVLRVEQTT